MSAWQPIETAPKDGTRILAFAKANGRMSVTWWRAEYAKHGYTGWGEFNTHQWPASHWMPLPAPPVSP